VIDKIWLEKRKKLGYWISPTFIVAPITAEKLLERGFCCGLKCKNCPYFPRYKKGNKTSMNEKTPNKVAQIIDGDSNDEEPNPYGLQDGAEEGLHTFVTCVCHIEVHGANEYEALEEVDQMIEKKYKLSEKIALTVKETITTTAFGCGVNYDHE